MKVKMLALMLALFGAFALMAPATPSAAQEGELLTHIRVAHFSPDTPAVEVYLDGEFSGIQTLSFGDVSGWVELPAGTYSIAVAPAGTSIDDAAIGPANFTLGPGAWITVAATGSLSAGTLGADVISEDIVPIAPDESFVTVFHGIEDAPAVDVILPDGTALISDLTFGNAETITVAPGTYDLSVVAAGTTEPAVIDLSGTTLEGETFYLVAATNTLAEPIPNLTALAESRIAPLFGKRLVTQDIVDIATGDSRFETLVTALQAADLVETLQGDGPFTVFAPTDEAFAALPEGTLDSLLNDIPALTDILLYHVVSGKALAADVVDQDSINALGGGINVTVTEDGDVFLNDDIQIIITDIQATNGVIHVIDGVLIP